MVSHVSAVAARLILLGIDTIEIVPFLMLDHASMKLASIVFHQRRVQAQGIVKVLMRIRIQGGCWRVRVQVVVCREGVKLPLVDVVMISRRGCGGEIERIARSRGLDLVPDGAGGVAMSSGEGVGVAAGCEEPHVDARLVVCVGSGSWRRARRRDKHGVLPEGGY